MTGSSRFKLSLLYVHGTKQAAPQASTSRRRRQQAAGVIADWNTLLGLVVATSLTHPALVSEFSLEERPCFQGPRTFLGLAPGPCCVLAPGRPRCLLIHPASASSSRPAVFSFFSDAFSPLPDRPDPLAPVQACCSAGCAGPLAGQLIFAPLPEPRSGDVSV